MNVLVIGANGQIGTELCRILAESEDELKPVAMIRKKSQKVKFGDLGVESVLADLEEDITPAFEGIDAVVFTAGSGAETPKAMTKVIDRDGAIKAIDTAVEQNAERFIMISAMGADLDPEKWPENMKHYYEAKKAADDHLIQSGLKYTILKPGRLTNDEAKGKVELGEHISQRKGEITRQDVALVVKALLNRTETSGMSLELLQGDMEIEAAVDASVNQ